MLLIGLPEETRVVEARPQHALVAVPDDPCRGRRRYSAPPGNAASSLPSCIFDGKIFLVVTHHRDQDFLRQSRNSGSKLPRITDGHSVRLTTVSSSDLSSRQRAPEMVRVAASSALRISLVALLATDYLGLL